MAKRSKSNFRIDCIRALLVVAFAAALGFCANAFSAKPLPLFPPPDEDAANPPTPSIPVSPRVPNPSDNPAAPPVVRAAPIVKPKTITLPELMEGMKGKASLLLLDVRSKYDFEAGHVPQAMNVPSDELPQQQSVELYAALLSTTSRRW